MMSPEREALVYELDTALEDSLGPFEFSHSFVERIVRALRQPEPLTHLQQPSDEALIAKLGEVFCCDETELQGEMLKAASFGVPADFLTYFSLMVRTGKQARDRLRELAAMGTK